MLWASKRSAYRTGIQRLVDLIVEIPSKCSPGRVAVHCANLLLRYCCAQKATHLTRLLPVHRTRPMALHIDNVMFDGFD